jgi:alpha-glucoside transport system permease protein
VDFFLNDKFGQMLFVIIAFAALVAVLLTIAWAADKWIGKGRRWAALAVFGGPALLLLVVGLIYPAIRTFYMSFYDAGTNNAVGLQNYIFTVTNTGAVIAFRNTFIWVILVPILSTVIGLLYAILIDKSRLEKLAKSLLFLPMAISFVGAGIIWKFVYEYRGAAQEQIGLLNAFITWLGFEPVRFLQDAPWNTLFLIAVMIWIQAGFAMVILSAAIKAVPTDIIEAARLDGVNAWEMFRNITVPSIRPSLVVVLTTISIATLKIFDITRTMTGARFDTQVLANQMYDYSFVFGDNGVGSAMAVVIFILVIPLVAFNIRQMAKNRAVRG